MPSKTTVGARTDRIKQGSSIVFTTFVYPCSLTPDCSGPPADGPLPTGNVTIVGTANGGSPVSIGTGMLANGSFSVATTALPPGENSITAQYDGDGIYAQSGSETQVYVAIPSKSDSQTTLTADHTVIAADGSTVLTLTAEVVADTSKELTIQTGSVIFYSDNIAIASRQLTTGQNFNGTFSSTTILVASMQANALPAPANGVARSRNLWLSGGGGTALACLTLLLPGRRRRWPMAALLFLAASSVFAIAGCAGAITPMSVASVPGPRSLTVQYSGDGNYNPSTSQAVKVTVR